MCVPDSAAVDLLGAVPDGVEVVAWNGETERPDGLARTEFWVPQVEEPGDLPAMFAAMPQLKVIQLTGAGIEDVAGHVPDGVMLCDARGIHGGPVSDLVLLLILALQRKLPEFLADQRDSRWEPSLGEDLADKHVVIVGAGDLGEKTAARLRGFGAVPVLVGTTARDGVRGVDELPGLLRDADVVVLTLPLTDRTAGMVDAQFLARMPDGAILINVARGKIVDTEALRSELESGRLRAGLDVVEPEPLPSDHPLWQAPNLILTPHTAGNVARAGLRAFRLVNDQIRRFVANETLLNVVDGDY